MIRVALLATVAAALAVPAMAGAPTAPTQTTASRPEDKVVCRFVNTTGSRLSREKECKTRADWNRESDETADDIDRQRDRATGEATNAPH
jgi:hypothetical protein